jgi:hypothetical protein
MSHLSILEAQPMFNLIAVFYERKPIFSRDASHGFN